MSIPSTYSALRYTYCMYSVIVQCPCISMYHNDQQRAETWLSQIKHGTTNLDIQYIFFWLYLLYIEIDNIRTLSENIIFISESFKNKQKSKYLFYYRFRYASPSKTTFATVKFPIDVGSSSNTIQVFLKHNATINMS